MNQTTFLKAASSVGVSAASLYTVFPHRLGVDLQHACKRYARALEKKVPGLKHAAALEVVAKAVGQEHWHGLHSRLALLVDHYASAEGNVRAPLDLSHFSSLLPALILLSPAERDLAPTPEAASGMSTLACQLAGKLPVSKEEALDAVSTVHGASSWQELLTRRPETSKGPLYGFHVDASGDGRFYESSACWALVEGQDDFFDQYIHRSNAEKKRCLEHVRRTVQIRPDFLEGHLVLGSILRLEGQDDEGGQALKTGIERAQKLIPKSFKGKLPWGSLGNRFYHRLLYSQMELAADYGKTSKAIALARKQLRVNPEDNLGIRFFLPLLLCADGQFSAAQKATTRLAGDNDGLSYLVHGICHLFLGEQREGHTAFLRALFVMPQLRYVLKDEPMTKEEEKATRRAGGPDPFQVWSVKNVVLPHFPRLNRHFRMTLQRPAVIAEERRLKHLFDTEWGRMLPNDQRTWQNETKSAAALLAKKIPALNAVR